MTDAGRIDGSPGGRARCGDGGGGGASALPPPPRVMGVINTTPDSFSDGGLFLDPARAIEHGLELASEGASILDVGGMSTRPGAAPVDPAVELDRVLPVIEGLAGRTPATLSIDTTRASVAEAALDAGATIVNDVSAATEDPAMLGLVANRAGATLVLMHRQGDPVTMQVAPRYDDAVADVAAYLEARVEAAAAAGVDPARIVLDPGIGFGKRLEDNLALLARLGELRSLGRPILLGVSRKSFIGHVTGAQHERDHLARERQDLPSDRIGGTAAAIALAAAEGSADIYRVHDVRVMVEALAVARAIAGARA